MVVPIFKDSPPVRAMSKAYAHLECIFGAAGALLANPSIIPARSEGSLLQTLAKIPTEPAQRIAEYWGDLVAQAEVPEQGGRILTSLLVGNAIEFVMAEYGDEPWAYPVAAAFEDVLARPDVAKVLFAALVPAIVSALDDVIGACRSFHLSAYPEQLDEVVVKLGEARSTPTVELLQVVADERLKAFLMSALSDQDKWFRKTLKAGLSELAYDWPTIVELYARRHSIIHTRGEVTKEYLALVQLDGYPHAPGYPLITDGNYVLTAADSAGSLAVRIGSRCALSWRPDEHSRGLLDRYLLQIGMTACVDRLWRTSLAAIGEWTRIADDDDPNADTMYINRAICHRKLGGLRPSDIAAMNEIESRPGVDLLSRTAARLVVAHPEAMADLGTCVDHGLVTYDDLLRWPLFDEWINRDKLREMTAAVPAATQ